MLGVRHRRPRFTVVDNIALIAAVGAPYAALAATIVLVFSVIYRWIALSVFAVVIVAANLAVQVPWYYFGRPPDIGDHVGVRVLSSNLRNGQADASSVAGLARTSADVITLSELTPDWIRRFYDTGIRAEIPYSLLVPAPGAGGFGLPSRFPLEPVSQLQGGSMITGRTQIPGVSNDPVVAAVHIMNPLTYYGRASDQWRDGITRCASENGRPRRRCRGTERSSSPVTSTARRISGSSAICSPMVTAMQSNRPVRVSRRPSRLPPGFRRSSRSISADPPRRCSVDPYRRRAGLRSPRVAGPLSA